MPGNVRRIFLGRHGLSASNVDKKLHHEIPGHAIPLHEGNKKQAGPAGIFLRNYLDPLGDIRPRMWVSPYKRTRQTADGIEAQLGTFAVPEYHPTAFGPVSDWGTREATRLLRWLG